VLVDDPISTSGSWTRAHVVTHEPGDTLGFRHDHTRPESATCVEDDTSRLLASH
jgi:hypothetical protein